MFVFQCNIFCANLGPKFVKNIIKYVCNCSLIGYGYIFIIFEEWCRTFQVTTLMNYQLLTVGQEILGVVSLCFMIYGFILMEMKFLLSESRTQDSIWVRKYVGFMLKKTPLCHLKKHFVAQDVNVKRHEQL